MKNVRSPTLLSLALVAVVTIVFCAMVSASTQGKPRFKVGDRIECDNFGTGKSWDKGTVVPFLEHDLYNGNTPESGYFYRVKLDGSSGSSGSRLCKAEAMRPLAGTTDGKNDADRKSDIRAETNPPAQAPAAPAQTFKAGDHVEALPFGFDWYPCVVTQGAPNYRVRCTNIDGTTSDYGITPNRLRADTGQVAAAMASRWAQRFPIGARVEAAPNGEQNGYHPCTVLSVTGNGAKIGIYHLRCDYGYENGPIEVDVGAVDYIRPLTAATANAAERKQAALDEQNRPPAAVKVGSYVCSTFTGGHLQVVPSLDMKVTGSSSYTDRQGQAGTFSYDVATGLVSFRGGSWSGARAKYLSRNGGQFKLMVGDHTANTDCNLRAQ